MSALFPSRLLSVHEAHVHDETIRRERASLPAQAPWRVQPPPIAPSRAPLSLTPALNAAPGQRIHRHARLALRTLACDA